MSLSLFYYYYYLLLFHIDKSHVRAGVWKINFRFFLYYATKLTLLVLRVQIFFKYSCNIVIKSMYVVWFIHVIKKYILFINFKKEILKLINYMLFICLEELKSGWWRIWKSSLTWKKWTNYRIDCVGNSQLEIDT